MAEFEELRLQITLVDNASLGLMRLNAELGRMTGEVKKVTPELSKINTQVANLNNNMRPLKGAAREIEGLAAAFTQLSSAAIGVSANLGPAASALASLGRAGPIGLVVAAVGAAVIGMNNALRDFSRQMQELQNKSRSAGILPDAFRNISKQLELFGYTAEDADATVLKFMRTMREITRPGTSEFNRMWKEAWDPEQAHRFNLQINEMIRRGQYGRAMETVAKQGRAIYQRELARTHGNEALARRAEESFYELRGVTLQFEDIKNLTDQIDDPGKYQRNIELAKQFNTEWAKTSIIFRDMWEDIKTELLPEFKLFNQELQQIDGKAVSTAVVWAFQEVKQFVTDVKNIIQDVKDFYQWWKTHGPVSRDEDPNPQSMGMAIRRMLGMDVPEDRDPERRRRLWEGGWPMPPEPRRGNPREAPAGRDQPVAPPPQRGGAAPQLPTTPQVGPAIAPAVPYQSMPGYAPNAYPAPTDNFNQRFNQATPPPSMPGTSGVPYTNPLGGQRQGSAGGGGGAQFAEQVNPGAAAPGTSDWAANLLPKRDLSAWPTGRGGLLDTGSSRSGGYMLGDGTNPSWGGLPVFNPATGEPIDKAVFGRYPWAGRRGPPGGDTANIWDRRGTRPVGFNRWTGEPIFNRNELDAVPDRAPLDTAMGNEFTHSVTGDARVRVDVASRRGTSGPLFRSLGMIRQQQGVPAASGAPEPPNLADQLGLNDISR